MEMDDRSRGDGRVDVGGGVPFRRSDRRAVGGPNAAAITRTTSPDGRARAGVATGVAPLYASR
jgi:hypothetical protein